MQWQSKCFFLKWPNIFEKKSKKIVFASNFLFTKSMASPCPVLNAIKPGGMHVRHNQGEIKTKEQKISKEQK